MKRESTVEVSADLVHNLRAAAAGLRMRLARAPAASTITLTIREATAWADATEASARQFRKMAELVDQALEAVEAQRETIDALAGVSPKKHRGFWWRLTHVKQSKN